MTQIRMNRATLEEVQISLDQYRELLSELENRGVIMENTRKTYLLHSENFVRWLRGEFDPGARRK